MTIRKLIAGALAIAFVIAIPPFISACNGGGSATAADNDSGYVTTAQAQQIANQAAAAAVAPLEAQIATLQTQLAAVQSSSANLSSLYLTIQAPNAAPILNRARTYAAGGGTSPGPACKGLGTINRDDLPASAVLHGISCAGYRYGVTASLAGDVSHFEELPATTLVGFDGPNCSGNAYVEANASSFASATVAQGIVFVMDTSAAGGATPNYASPSSYWYLATGESAASYPEISAYIFGTGCLGTGGATLTGYPIKPNAPATTGLPTGLITGPVLVGKP